jgi:large subunit ribosomal protein L25
MDATLQAVKRADKGKNEARRHRAAGRLPAVVYGAGDPVPVTVEPKALSKILHSDSGANTLITLSIDGEADSRVLVKEYQLDPITRHFLHADFYRVAMDKALTVDVSVVLEGEPKGVKQQGGVLEFIRREVVIEVLPADIPEHIDVDVTELMLHQGIRVRDIAVSAKWKPVSDLDLMLVHVIMPKAVEVAAPADAATATVAEPEVLKKGKKDEEEAEKKDDKKKDEKKKDEKKK